MAYAEVFAAGEMLDWTADAAYNTGDVIQLPDGRAGVISDTVASGAVIGVHVGGIFRMTKTTSMVLLKGGRAYWDNSANKVYFRTINDADFYVGRLTTDAASADTVCYVELNVRVKYDVDYKVDPGKAIPVGTAAAGGFGRGLSVNGPGNMNLLLTSTSEAQKIDWLSKDGFLASSNPIVEFMVSVPTGTAAGGAQDLNIGLASATHATDADSIAQHCFIHIDGNSVNVLAQSKSTGVSTVTATDTTIDITAGSTNAAGVRLECWLDCRNPADVQIYIDGVLVLPSSIFDISGAGSTTLFLLAHLEKTSATDTAEVDVDFLAARLAKV